MAGTLISKIVNGEDGTTSFTNLQQSFLVMLRDYDGMLYGNYAPGNTGMLNVLAESVIGVNYNLYKWADAQTISKRNVDGSTSDIRSAADGAYYLVAVVGADSICTIYAMLCSAVTVAANASYAGWYITGTTVRVLGGFTKTGASYVRKWRYQVANGYANESQDYNYRIYADGYEGKTLINKDLVSVYSSNTDTQHETTPVDIAAFITTCPCTFHMVTSALEWGSNYEHAHSTLFRVQLIYCDADGSELTVLETRDHIITAAQANYNSVFLLLPGAYKVRFVPLRSSGTYSPSTNATVAYDVKVETKSIVASIRNTYGAIKGTY